MSKQASVDLGINFSFIIIVALIILGVALVFVLDVFKFADEKVPTSAPEIVFHASQDNPLYPEGRELEVKPGKQAEFLVSVYNQDWSSEDFIGISMQDCTDSEGLLELGISLKAVEQSIPREKDRGYKVIISAEQGVRAGMYICTLMAGVVDENGVVNTNELFHSRQVSISVV